MTLAVFSVVNAIEEPVLEPRKRTIVRDGLKVYR